MQVYFGLVLNLLNSINEYHVDNNRNGHVIAYNALMMIGCLFCFCSGPLLNSVDSVHVQVFYVHCMSFSDIAVERSINHSKRKRSNEGNVI